MSDIKTRIEAIQAEITQTALSKGRNPEEIQLIAVSKGQPLEKIKEAMECGLTCFGENYVQEFLEKWEVLGSKPSWVFIGHLQTNKVKYLADKISAIHTVGSLKLFQMIQKEAEKARKKIPVLIEINIGEEKTKSGVFPKDVSNLLKSLPQSPWVKLQGFMIIPPFYEDPEKSRPYFKKMAMLQKELQKQFPQYSLKELSMGMTHDFKIAIEEGATQVRIGEGIFGKRQTKN